MKNTLKTKKTFISIKFRSIFIAATVCMFLEYVMGLTDKIIVGHFLNSAALPALTLIEPLNLIIAFLACALSAGASMQVSASLGKGEQTLAEKQFSQTLILAVLIGTLITAVYLIFFRQIIAALAGSLPEAQYVTEYFYFARFLPVPMLLNAVVYPIVLYRGGEKYCNYSALFSIAGNIGLSIVLVFVMGMKGIGLGTVIGSWAGLVPLVFFLSTDKGHMQFRWHLSLTDIRDMGVYSVGNSIIYLYMAIFQICMNAFLLHHFDSTAIVVFTGVINLVGMFAALSDGIGEFLLCMINMYRGEKNVIGERQTMLTSLKASIIEALVIMTIILLFAGAMPSLFGVHEPSVRSSFINAARIYVLCAPFFYTLNLYVKYYLYIGKFFNSLLLSLCLTLVFPLAFGLLGGLMLDVTGVWIGMAAALPILLCCTYLLIRRQDGSDALCMFLDQKRMTCQHSWDVEMTEPGITTLMDNAERVMLDNGIPRSKINKVLLAIEETQMDDLLQNKNAAGLRIECTLLLEDKITLILRNTGVLHNAAEPSVDASEEQQLRYHILSSMQNKSYILVNGSNRFIFEF